MRVRAALPGVGTTFEYVYDFGDVWQHDLLLEAIIMPVPDMPYPRCIEGVGHCPPEDAGGIGGYRNYIEAMADPSHEEHQDMMMWRGPFDPKEFSVEKVNQELTKNFAQRTSRLSKNR